MPIRPVGARAATNWRHLLLQRLVIDRVPEPDAVAPKVDLVSNVVPHVGLPRRLPQALLLDHELQVRVLGALLAADPAVLHLGEVALEEANLVLAVDRGGVGGAAHHAEVVELLALVDALGSLRDQLGAAHGLAVPEGGGVEGELGTLLGARVVGILVLGREVDVRGDGAGAVDVPLVWTDLVGPGPSVEVGGGGHVVEAAVPDYGSVDSESAEEGGEGELHFGLVLRGCSGEWGLRRHNWYGGGESRIHGACTTKEMSSLET